MKQFEKYYNSLELPVILEQVSLYACCEYAKEQILSIKPSNVLEDVKNEVEITNNLLYLTSHHGTPSFSNMENPTSYLDIANLGGILNAASLINIGTILRQGRILKDWYSSCSKKYDNIAYIFEAIREQKQLEKRIFKVFISEDEIDDYASEGLFLVRQKIRQTEIKVRDIMDKMIKSTTYQKALQENIITIRDGRYVLLVKAECKSQINGLVHDISSSGATLFVEPMSVVEANNEIRVLKSKEKEEIDKILAELSALCSDVSDDICNCFIYSINLNVFFAKVNYAAYLKCSMPVITDNGFLKLKKARHPLIDKDKVVPIDIELGGEYKTIIITGPNTGGKTVTLKTVGLLTLMTMCGMLIPVNDDSVISIFDKILVDIGDEQSISQSLSTFSGHMKNIISILSHVDNKSLVLVDELGSGTDPVEGAAIATAILEKFRQNGGVTLATTHYAELKIYALQKQGVKNASCEFDVNTLSPTYRLIIGTPGRSNAFEISRKLGLDDDILKTASLLIASEKKSFEDVIDELEYSRQEFEKKTLNLNKELIELRKLKEEIQSNNKDILLNREKMLERARIDARKIVENVKADSALLMEELNKIKKAKEDEDFLKNLALTKTKIKGKIDKIYDIANPVIGRDNNGYILPRKLKVGDDVLIVDIDKQGVVLREQDKSGNVLIQAGIIKSKVNISNIRLIELKKSSIKSTTSRTIRIKKEIQSIMELDIRGQMVEDAIIELEMFLNDALLSNIYSFTIIHGKGTGALRKAVHSYLKNVKQVKSYRLGTFGEGESGVTIVEF